MLYKLNYSVITNAIKYFRLIRGDGEILEEIVSKQQHELINRQATIGDGTYFQKIVHDM